MTIPALPPVDAIDFLSRHMRLVVADATPIARERINAELSHTYTKFRALVGSHGDLDDIWRHAARISVLLAAYADMVEDRRAEENQGSG